MLDQLTEEQIIHLQKAFCAAFTELMNSQRGLLMELHRIARSNREQLDELKEKIMTALDDLKANIAALIAEATSDVTGLVQQLADKAAVQGGVPSGDIEALAKNVSDATASLHNSFMAATGTPVPATTTTGSPSNAIDPGSSAASSTPASAPATAPAPASAPASAPATSPDTNTQSQPVSAPASAPSTPTATTIGPDSFKSGA